MWRCRPPVTARSCPVRFGCASGEAKADRATGARAAAGPGSLAGEGSSCVSGTAIVPHPCAQSLPKGNERAGSIPAGGSHCRELKTDSIFGGGPPARLQSGPPTRARLPARATAPALRERLLTGGARRRWLITKCSNTCCSPRSKQGRYQTDREGADRAVRQSGGRAQCRIPRRCSASKAWAKPALRLWLSVATAARRMTRGEIIKETGAGFMAGADRLPHHDMAHLTVERVRILYLDTRKPLDRKTIIWVTVRSTKPRSTRAR